jgi:RNA polymerase sigma-70 factor (ECF subfamily)
MMLQAKVDTPVDNTTDHGLLIRASGGDETAFVVLYQRHRDAVFRFSYRMLGSEGPAEDVTQDCFLHLLKHPSRFDPKRAGLRTYLLAIARNLSLKHFSRQAAQVGFDEAEDESADTLTRGPLQNLLDGEVSELVRMAVSKLVPLQREALILFEYEELTLAEIASVTGTDIGTVKARLYRARRQLRRSLAPYFENGPRSADRSSADEVLK